MSDLVTDRSADGEARDVLTVEPDPLWTQMLAGGVQDGFYSSLVAQNSLLLDIQTRPVVVAQNCEL